MWKLKASALLFLLAVDGSAQGTVEAQVLSPTPSAGSGQALVSNAATFVSQAKLSVCAEIAILDGGPLTQALAATVARGVPLSLVLDPSDRGTRDQGRKLLATAQAASPTAQPLQLRWFKGAGRSQRRVLVDGKKLLRWQAGQDPQADDAGAAAFAHRFEKRWPLASDGLPEGLTLEDDLRALPDPREQDPRISRRREAAGE